MQTSSLVTSKMASWASKTTKRESNSTQQPACRSIASAAAPVAVPKQGVFFKSRRSQSVSAPMDLKTTRSSVTSTQLPTPSQLQEPQQQQQQQSQYHQSSLACYETQQRRSSARGLALPKIQEDSVQMMQQYQYTRTTSLPSSVIADRERISSTPSTLGTNSTTTSSTFSTGVANITCSISSSCVSRPSSIVPPTPPTPKLDIPQTSETYPTPLIAQAQSQQQQQQQPTTASSAPSGPAPSHMAQCLNTALTLAVAHLRAQPGVDSCLESTIFLLDCRPSVTLLDYIARLEHHMRCDEHTLVIAAVLISRLEAKLNRPILSPKTVHKIAVTAIVVAKKLHEDKSMKNSATCQIAGLPLLELNALEALFTDLLGFQLFVSPDQHSRFQTALLSMLPAQN